MGDCLTFHVDTENGMINGTQLSTTNNTIYNMKLSRNDVEYRYIAHDDSLQVFFINTTPDMVASAKAYTETISVKCDKENRFLYLQVDKASLTLGCHLWNSTEIIDDLRYVSSLPHMKANH